LKNSKNIGLFFGSFNPIHVGHLIVGSLAVEKLGLDELWYVVSPHNPFKIAGSMADDELRVKMVNDAIKEHTRLKACDVELELPKPSYTIQTLLALKKINPGAHFIMLMGEDILDRFHEWKEIDRLLEMIKVVVYKRPNTGYKPHPVWEEKVTFLDLPLIDISSTYIRNLCREKKPITFLVHSTTEKSIRKYHLYE
jgi:nicotinate-nucleotide adenylyltransferase